jgi:hypothetical protein
MSVPDQSTSINVADVLAIDVTIMAGTASGDFGLTSTGFYPKPFARLLAEKLALARTLFGADLDLTSGSAVRKLLEVSALEDARTWAALAAVYDNSFVSTATGDALSRLGDELGLPRPFLEASGTVTLTLTGTLKDGTVPSVEIPRGGRMLTAGDHHVATNAFVTLSRADPRKDVPVVAFYPGGEHNLDPTVGGEKINAWNEADSALAAYLALHDADGSSVRISIDHTVSLTGGELQWPDARYRDLLLRAPRSLWSAAAVEIAASLVPGVRRVQVADGLGGLDINQSIFGQFNFLQRLFSSERDLASPYYLTILIAPTPAAIWYGPDGLAAAVQSAVQDLRPISIFPNVVEAEVVGVAVAADVVVSGLPLPNEPTVDASVAAQQLKRRLMDRVAAYVGGLGFGDPVRAAEVTWAMMSEPGVADVQNLRLLRYPPQFDTLAFTGGPPPDVQQTGSGENVELSGVEIAELVEDPSGLTVL